MKNIQKIILLLLFTCLVSPISIAQKLIYPEDEWETIQPNEIDLDANKIQRLFDLSFVDPATQGVTLIKDGYLVGERYAENYDEKSYGTSWSMAKSFYAALIGISIDLGENA